jgi:pimeloyl-ACP methyl ester carboxylesterase
MPGLQKFEFEGCPIAYRIAGEGPPLLMTQGVGAYGTSPNPLFDILEKHYTCLNYDNRGVGVSVPAGKPFSVPQMATDALALLDHVGWETAHVVGHSLGGLASMELVLTAKSRVRSLTLLNTFARGADASRMTPKLLWVLLRLQFGYYKMRRDAFMQMVLPPGFKGDRDAAARLLSGVLGHDVGELPASANLQLAAMKKHDVTAKLSALAGIPTLVISSAHDPIASAAAGRAIAAAIPGAVYVEIADASHSFPVVDPQECARMIIEHIDSVERGKAA